MDPTGAPVLREKEATMPARRASIGQLSRSRAGAQGSWYYPGAKNPEVTAMSGNLTHRPKRRANSRTLGDGSAIGVLREKNKGNKCRAYDDAARFRFVEVPAEERAVGDSAFASYLERGASSYWIVRGSWYI
ncbi:hypothetical protein Drorol1_Dr00014188 [Drosera rotundifolia]